MVIADTSRSVERSGHRKIKQGAGLFAGPCMMQLSNSIIFAGALLVSIAAPANLHASFDAPLPTATSFAYSISHPVTPLPDAVIERVVNTDEQDFYEVDAFDVPHHTPVDAAIGRPPALTRGGLCNAMVSVARANNLPISFFANLIWAESSFNVRTISRAGALGVAQFMPGTANEYGLINPFEPIHALHAAGRFLHKLHSQFGNLGLTAAAYNAGPRRVRDWMTKRGGLPTETRNYVVRITGRSAEMWTSNEFLRAPESSLLPAKAPCVEVAEDVAAQAKVVRVAKMVAELAATAQASARPESVNPDADKFDEAEWKVASARPEWGAHALNVVRGVLKNIREQEAREASAKRVSKTTARAWQKIAVRTMRKAAAEFAKDADEKAPPEKTPKRRTKVAYSR